MKQAVSKILLPLLVLLCIGIALTSILWSNFSTEYRLNSNLDVASVIGAVVATYPEVDTSDIISRLRSRTSSDTVATGEAILAQYGLMPGDYATSSSAAIIKKYHIMTLIMIISIVSVFCIYLIWLRYKQQRSIRQLVDYLQDISRHIYDLRPDDNDEDDFSLLTNELYKTAVMLKETAETNRRHSLALSNTLADISHQLRTPLTSIRVMVDNIYDDPDMPLDVRQDFLSSISRQAEAMAQHITTLLHLARFDNGSIKLRPQKLQAGDFLRSVVERLAVLAELSDVELEVLGDLDTTISLDEHWQREALINIVKNCIEHSPRGGVVKVSALQCPLYFRLTVQDQGIGMTAKVQRHIFERFYKAPGSTKDGIGIGLAFARAIIEAENGQISVSSTPGQGTTFTITYFS